MYAECKCLRCSAVHLVPVQSIDPMRTQRCPFVISDVVGKQLPAVTGFPAWNSYSLIVTCIRIRNRYNSADEEN